MFDGKQLSRKLVGSEDERAVSPVIGVILMVAITVILAAVIAAFVLDLGDSVGEEPNAGVSIDDSNSSAVQVSVTSMGNSDGIAIVNDSDVVYSNDHLLNNTGSSTTLEYEDGEVEGDYSVIAYIGSTPSAGQHPDETATATASIGSFTVEE